MHPVVFHLSTMSLFFHLCWAVTVIVAVLPVVYFLRFGWPAREAEFLDKVRVGTDGLGDGLASDRRAMQGYFEKFWSKDWANYLKAHPWEKALLAAR